VLPRQSSSAPHRQLDVRLVAGVIADRMVRATPVFSLPFGPPEFRLRTLFG
jgi:hypothetical protein